MRRRTVRAGIPFGTAAALLAALFSSGPARAEFGGGTGKTLYVGAGEISYNSLRFGTSSSGTSSPLGTVYTDLDASLHFGLGGFNWAPTVAYTLLGKTNADGDKTRLLIVTVPIRVPLSGGVDLKAGPGLLWYNLAGNGGSETLPNGTTTANFLLPDRSTNSRLYVVSVGAGYQAERLRFDLDGYVSDLATTRRAVTLSLHVNYAFFN